MGQTAIGRAALVLTTDASRARAGLHHFKDDATRIAGQTAESVRSAVGRGSQNLATSAADAAKSAGSRFSPGAFLGGLTGALLAPQVGKAIETITGGFFDWYTNAAKVRQELEKSGEAISRASRETDRAIARTDEWINAAADPKAKAGLVGNEIANIEAKIREQRNLQESLRKQFLELDEIGVKHIGKALGGDLDSSRNKLKQDLDAATASATKFEDRLAGLLETRKRLKDPSADPMLTGEINRATEALKLQAQTFGMTSAQAQVHSFRMRGATAQQLAALQQWADEMDTIQAKGKAAANAIKSDNPALLKGSGAEVSARIRHDFGGKTAQDRLLEEQRKATRLLGSIDSSTKATAKKPAVAVATV